MATLKEYLEEHFPAVVWDDLNLTRFQTIVLLPSNPKYVTGSLSGVIDTQAKAVSGILDTGANYFSVRHKELLSSVTEVSVVNHTANGSSRIHFSG